MTSTGAAIPVLFDSAAYAAIVITFTFEVTCVAGGAEGRVLRPWPRQGVGYGITMASVTAQGDSMITRIVSFWIMAEDAGCPATG